MDDISVQKGKVLVVEDDRTLRRATVELFKALGYDALTAEDGVAAIKLIEAEPSIDFLFTDAVMPKGINGVELIEKARQLRPSIKVLLASGYPFDKIDTHGAITEDNFISKPYRVAQLAEKIASL